MELKESKAALTASESEEEEGMLDESEEELNEQQKQF